MVCGWDEHKREGRGAAGKMWVKGPGKDAHTGTQQRTHDGTSANTTDSQLTTHTKGVQHGKGKQSHSNWWLQYRKRNSHLWGRPKVHTWHGHKPSKQRKNYEAQARGKGIVRPQEQWRSLHPSSLSTRSTPPARVAACVSPHHHQGHPHPPAPVEGRVAGGAAGQPALAPAP